MISTVRTALIGVLYDGNMLRLRIAVVACVGLWQSSLLDIASIPIAAFAGWWLVLVAI